MPRQPPSNQAPRILALLAVLGLGACAGERSPLGLGEPLRVAGAVFKEGALPGAAPSASAPGPQVTALESPNNIVRPRQAGKKLAGRTTPDAAAVGIRFEGLGTGYWLLGVDAPDPAANGELTWEAQCDLGDDVPPGLHKLLFAAVDEGGRAGTQRELSVCVAPPYPDNLNACDPSIAPPEAVLGLSWDADVDLDLVLVVPGGATLDAKHPSTASGIGALDRDANGGCVIDAGRREHVVWQGKPTPGNYLVYASLFDACGRDSVRFEVTLYLPADRPDGKGKQLVERLRVPGALSSLDASGGATNGLFVTQFSFR